MMSVRIIWLGYLLELLVAELVTVADFNYTNKKF